MSLLRICLFFWSVLFLASSPGWTGDIVLPYPAFDRDSRPQALYRTQSARGGKGQLTVTWTDVYNRLVEQRKIGFELRSTSEVPFTLDLRRAVAMKNRLTVQLSFAGAKDRHEERAETSFI